MKPLLRLLATLTLLGVGQTAKPQDLQRADRPPVVEAVAPIYPLTVTGYRFVDVSGTVTIRVRISPPGTVEGEPDYRGLPLLKHASVEAAKRWRFAPSDNAQGERTVELIFIFTTKPRDAGDAELMTTVRPASYMVEVKRRTIEPVESGGEKRRRR